MPLCTLIMTSLAENVPKHKIGHVFHDSQSFYRIIPSRWQFHWSRRHKPHPLPLERPSFATLAHWPVQSLPFSVRHSAVARKYLSLLRPIDWASFPDRVPHRILSGPCPASPVPYLMVTVQPTLLKPIAVICAYGNRQTSWQQMRIIPTESWDEAKEMAAKIVEGKVKRGYVVCEG